MAKVKALSYPEVLVRAAQRRAAAIAHLNKPDISPWQTLAEVTTAVGADPENKTDRDSVRFLLDAMANNKQISKSKDGKVSLFAAAGRAAPEATPATPPVKRGNKGRSNSQGVINDMTFDIVKATGRVRITLGELVIEIGVV